MKWVFEMVRLDFRVWIRLLVLMFGDLVVLLVLVWWLCDCVLVRVDWVIISWVDRLLRWLFLMLVWLFRLVMLCFFWYFDSLVCVCL